MSISGDETSGTAILQRLSQRPLSWCHSPLTVCVPVPIYRKCHIPLTAGVTAPWKRMSQPSYNGCHIHLVAGAILTSFHHPQPIILHTCLTYFNPASLNVSHSTQHLFHMLCHATVACSYIKPCRISFDQIRSDRIALERTSNESLRGYYLTVIACLKAMAFRIENNKMLID